MKLSALTTENALDTTGVWKDYSDGVRFLLRRQGCKEFDDCIAKLSKPYRKETRDGELPPEVSRELNMKATAMTLVLGWEGITDDEGNDLPFTNEAVLDAMKKNYRFYRDVVQMCSELEAEDAQEVKDSLGN